MTTTTTAASTASFPINPELTSIAIAYRNPDIDLIADEVLPRRPGGQKFNWTSYSKDQAYTVPDTAVGRKSEPNVVDFGGTVLTDETTDWGLDDIVPNLDIEAYNAMPKPATGGPISPQAQAALFTTSLIELDREIRVANLVFNANTYPSGNRVTLSGTSQWSDPTSDPVSSILNALDQTLVRANTLLFGRQVFTQLRKHPKIVQAAFRNLAGAGVVSEQAVADIFSVKRVIVGSAWVNNARRGQPANFVRVWGKHAAALFVSSQAATLDQPTFGFTHQFGTRIAGELPEPKMGLRGSVRVRVGESVKEIISAPDVGYFWQNAVA